MQEAMHLIEDKLENAESGAKIGLKSIHCNTTAIKTLYQVME